MGPAKRTAAHKNFSARRPNKNRQNSKGTRHCQRYQKGPKRRKAKTREQRRVQKESKKQSQKERAKRERAKSPKRVASKDQQGEVPDPSFEGVCLSAGKVPNQD